MHAALVQLCRQSLLLRHPLFLEARGFLNRQSVQTWVARQPVADRNAFKFWVLIRGIF